jgi:hypothetical protein
MRAARFVLLALVVAACGRPEPLAPASDGYAALRVVRPVRVATRTMSYDIPVGTTLIADRSADGIPLYCGTVLARDVLAETPTRVCASYKAGILAINPHKPFGGPPNTLPPDAIEEFRTL